MSDKETQSFDRQFWIKLQAILIILYWILKWVVVILEISKLCKT